LLGAVEVVAVVIAVEVEMRVVMVFAGGMAVVDGRGSPLAWMQYD
jgi:hypothetical protein